MVTLRQMVKQDPAIGAVSREECLLLASVLDAYMALARHWFFKFFIPKKHKNKIFNLDMLAAVLGRANSFQEPDSPMVNQLFKAMEKA